MRSSSKWLSSVLKFIHKEADISIHQHLGSIGCFLNFKLCNVYTYMLCVLDAASVIIMSFDL